MVKKQVRIGLDKVLGEEMHLIAGRRVGLICNQSSVNRSVSTRRRLVLRTPASRFDGFIRTAARHSRRCSG
jgi:uncharacterized protein YbbC (DUF1343 family)